MTFSISAIVFKINFFGAENVLGPKVSGAESAGAESVGAEKTGSPNMNYTLVQKQNIS